jgi:predicted ArsR family transcriptional regulator
MPRVKRPTIKISSAWAETNQAAEELGITPRQLRKLRASLFKAGTHYRVKNPTAARPEYLWHVEKCAKQLTPIEMRDS